MDKQTTDQVKVLTVPTTGDEDIFDFSQRHYRLWKLGTKAKSNGALIVVAVQDHKDPDSQRIWFGGRLCPILGAVLCRERLRRIIFAKENSPTEYDYLTTAVINKIADDAGINDRRRPDVRHVEGQGASSVPPIVIWIFVLLIFGVIIWMSYHQGSSGGSSGWYGGSGWGGGGFGGFGGGSFGGGGG